MTSDVREPARTALALMRTYHRGDQRGLDRLIEGLDRTELVNVLTVLVGFAIGVITDTADQHHTPIEDVFDHMNDWNEGDQHP